LNIETGDFITLIELRGIVNV